MLNTPEMKSRIEKVRAWGKREKLFKEAANKAKGEIKIRYDRLAKLCYKNCIAETKKVHDKIKETLTPAQYKIFLGFIEVTHKS